MIKIVKGDKQWEVPKTTYERKYKKNGWVPLGEEAQAEEESEAVVSKGSESEESESEDGWDDEPEEKPLSALSNTELKERAEALGIDGAKMSSKQLREAIRSAQK